MARNMAITKGIKKGISITLILLFCTNVEHNLKAKLGCLRGRKFSNNA